MSEEKVGAVRSLEHFPIVVVATTRTSTVLADWRSQTRLQFCAAALAIVIVIGMVFLIVRKLRQQHAAAQHMLSEKTRHLDTAINNMTQGLLLFDASGPSRDLQPAIYRHVRSVAGHRQARLPPA